MNRSSISKRPLLFLVGLTFVVLLILASSGADSLKDGTDVVQAAPRQQTLPVVGFQNLTYTVIEPNDAKTTDVEIKVIISEAPATDKVAKVTYSTANGTATAPQDYVQTTGELTFPAGSIEAQTFNVTINGNNLAQSNRSFTVFLTNPVNATVSVANAITTITIVDNDAAPATSTPTATPGGDIFLDKYEPNNVFDTAYTTSANATKLTNITLWPVGDVDFFQFFAKDGSTYQVFTTDLSAGLDTYLKVYDPDGEKFAENDDVDDVNFRSQLEFTADDDGFYFAKITNKEPSDPTNKTYSFGVNEIVPPTPTATATRIGQLDACEKNNSIGSACLIGDGAAKTGMNFIPPEGTGTDNDFYRLPVKPGILYTCETTNLSPPNDTNIIFLDHNGNDFNPQLGNDDRALGDKSSLLSWYSTYQGNLYILVGPVNPPPYSESPQYTYDLVCNGLAATLTPTPTADYCVGASSTQ